MTLSRERIEEIKSKCYPAEVHIMELEYICTLALECLDNRKEIEELKRRPTPKMATEMMLDVKRQCDKKLTRTTEALEVAKECLEKMQYKVKSRGMELPDILTVRDCRCFSDEAITKIKEIMEK